MNYEDAIKKIKKLLDDAKKQGHIIIRVEDIENSFPELKESEGEKIKDAAIEFVRQNKSFNYSLGISKEEVIAWLEKQGEKNLSTDFSDLRTWKYIVDAVWTEKEGIGQYLDSPFTEEIAKKLQKRFGNIEQKPANDIEPKFHEGDWVTNGMCTFKIASIENGFYYDTNNCGSDIESIDKSYHLWTIDDAKEGDILAYPDGSLVIFKYRLRGLNAGLYMGSVLFTDKIEFSRTCTILNAKPATKEQCNFLFEALEEAGYEWDNINKKVKELY